MCGEYRGSLGVLSHKILLILWEHSEKLSNNRVARRLVGIPY